MTIFRNGPLYLVYHGAGRGFVFDSLDGESTPDLVPADYLRGAARFWKPVPDTEPIPAGLVARLILPFPGVETCPPQPRT
jgi:hypothetical protein